MIEQLKGRRGIAFPEPVDQVDRLTAMLAIVAVRLGLAIDEVTDSGTLADETVIGLGEIVRSCYKAVDAHPRFQVVTGE